MTTCADDHLHVADAVEALPDDLRAALALGPLDEPECRICTVLKQGCITDAAETILDFHDLGDEEFAEATHDALGRDRRLTANQRAAGLGYLRKLERIPERNVQRLALESLAGNLNWWRCLYVYTLAGWRP